jgi:hypothetical protein
MRYSRAEYAKILAAQQEVCRAEEDYHRLRGAYVELAKSEPGHEVALAMVGADMDRAHAHLQFLIGLPRAAFTPEPAPAASASASSAKHLAEQPEEQGA